MNCLKKREFVVACIAVFVLTGCVKTEKQPEPRRLSGEYKSDASLLNPSGTTSDIKDVWDFHSDGSYRYVHDWTNGEAKIQTIFIGTYTIESKKIHAKATTMETNGHGPSPTTNTHELVLDDTGDLIASDGSRLKKQ
jgi:hypothetical protein